MDVTSSRRGFVLGSLLAIGAATMPVFASRAATPQSLASGRAPIKLGLASYTFRNLSRAQLIGLVKQLQLPELNAKDVTDHLPADPALESAAVADYTANGIKLHAIGAVYFPYEVHAEDSMPGLISSFAYMPCVLAPMRYPRPHHGQFIRFTPWEGHTMIRGSAYPTLTPQQIVLGALSRVSRCLTTALALGALLFLLNSCMCINAQTVRTEQGMVQGKVVSGGQTRAFLGLPYAAPPVGDLRWKAPAPPAAWKGVRDATHFGHRCAQWQIWTDYLFLDPGPSEDCLYLNVYVPSGAKPTSKLPVMFWIHGGGYAAGASSEPRYTNSGLVQKGVVLVTINYRLGVFGFLCTKDLVREGEGHAGNYGLMDMVTALHWVKANIAALGGDPGNVTIFGESAGSFAVSTLMAAPDAGGLFHKAIGESGAAFSDVLSLPPLAERSERDQVWAESLGAKDLAQLRELSTQQLTEDESKKQVGWFSPVIDGRLVREPVAQTYAAGRQTHVPTIIGSNRDERTGTLSKGLTVDKWKAFAADHYGTRAPQFLTAFPGNSDEEAVRSADTYTTDTFIALSAWKWAQAQVQTGNSNVFRYRFDLPAPPSEAHPEGKYAFHSDELEYVFGTLDTRHGASWRPEDRILSQQLIEYWTNFARTGDPNGTGLPHWPPYGTTRQVIYFDRTTTTGKDIGFPQYTFLTQ